MCRSGVAFYLITNTLISHVCNVFALLSQITVAYYNFCSVNLNRFLVVFCSSYLILLFVSVCNHNHSSTVYTLLHHLLGPLDAPYNFSAAMWKTSFNLSWGAPFSLDVTGYSPDIFNYTLCTNITIYGCKTIPSDPDCTFPRTCTSSVDFSDPSLNGTSKTIMDYGDPIVFKFFAVNGAGNGTLASFTYLKGLYSY